MSVGLMLAVNYSEGSEWSDPVEGIRQNDVFSKEEFLEMVNFLSVEVAKIKNTKKKLQAYDRASQPLDFSWWS